MAYENSDFTVPSSSQLSHLRNSRPCSFQCFVESLLELSTLSSRFPPAFQQFVTELREHGKEWMFLIGLLAARLQEANHVFFFAIFACKGLNVEDSCRSSCTSLNELG